ncbi:galanin peptides [Suncus etruscus]|uniref:galanin peptides n=1 Tax=Suncus etruscus TaxID=109475 RepID=UPI00210F764A|nr:galanin peptides [Suncus etruscus]
MVRGGYVDWSTVNSEVTEHGGQSVRPVAVCLPVLGHRLFTMPQTSLVPQVLMALLLETAAAAAPLRARRSERLDPDPACLRRRRRLRPDPAPRARGRQEPLTPRSRPSGLEMARPMPGAAALLLAALLLAAALPAAAGLGAPRKAKRGWTLNSAGYLLGPQAFDNHRPFPEQRGPAGKRELQLEADGRPGSFQGPENNLVRAALELLDFLRVRDARVLGSPPDMPLAVPEDQVQA